MLPDHLTDLGEKFAIRFGPLFEQLGTKSRLQEPALLPASGEASNLTCEGYRGGKEVEIVVVRARKDGGKPLAVRETLTYRKDVAGSDLVYDLTGEFMQGKARPFDCDLRQEPVRLYALLPFQIEHIRLSAKTGGDQINFQVEFQNALGNPAAGALPCLVQLGPLGEKATWERFFASTTEGVLSASVELPKAPGGKWSLTVRSLLDGQADNTHIQIGK